MTTKKTVATAVLCSIPVSVIALFAFKITQEHGMVGLCTLGFCLLFTSLVMWALWVVLNDY